jgi:hypothetical protein
MYMPINIIFLYIIYYLLPFVDSFVLGLIKAIIIIIKKKFVTQSRTGLQIYEGHGDQLNRPGPMA